MNFNFNNQRTKFHIQTPIMRHFSTIGLVATKPESNLLKPDCILKNVQNNFFSTFPGNVMSNKSFTNPNFVNKKNPNILTASVAGAFKLSCHDKLQSTHTQQPKHNSKVTSEENPMVYQPLPDKISSHNQSIVHKPEIQSSSELSKTKKQMRNRNRKHKKNVKPIQETIDEQKCNMTAKKNNKLPCSSPKKFKKSTESKKQSKKSKKCKPWHKISFNQEIMECDEPLIIENPPSEGFCVQIKSSPIEISPKCNGIISEALSISISPCSDFLKNLSTSNSSSDVMSVSPSSPAIRRLRMPSECDSEDSFIVFCNETNECLSEDVSSDESCDTDDEETDAESDFDLDFCEKTDLNKSAAKKKVTFKEDSELCEIHPMIKWGYAYRSARRGPWEQLALDRERFKSRVQSIGNILTPILNVQHRQKIYEDRFK